MIKKILIFNYSSWNQIIASLIEGLKFNEQLELFSTAQANYSEDILIKSQREYSVTKIHEPVPYFVPPSLYIASNVIDGPAYIKECRDLMDEADLIVMVDDNGSQTSAYFRSDNKLQDMLHQYGLYYHKEKTVLIHPGDFSGPDKMYGEYFGGDPSYYKVYFKREKDLELEWADNVEPFPFSAEERYFAAGKDFNKIWDNKDLNLSCLFRYSGHDRSEDGGGVYREDIKKAVNEKYYGDPKCITKNVFGRGRDDSIDKKIEGKEVGDAVRHHHKYFDVISKSKINIEGLPGHTAFYTGRMLESLANGCCYFYPTPTYNIDFPNGLVDGEDFIIYHSAEDLLDKIEYYLSHEKEMRAIAESGMNKLLKYHTSEVRAKEFIEICERYMYD